MRILSRWMTVDVHGSEGQMLLTTTSNILVDVERRRRSTSERLQVEGPERWLDRPASGSREVATANGTIVRMCRACGTTRAGTAE